jgi:photosynthetic reaction center cytochrome c subunit
MMSRVTVRVGGILLASCAVVAQATGRSASSQTVGQAYKNIQVLGELPARDLLRTMHLMRASLGTRCDYCHDVDRYESDSKPTKTTARRMIQMVVDLNNRHFGGAVVVTCNTCHRGAARPVPEPGLDQGWFPDTTRSPLEPPTRSAAPSEVIQRYIAAVGGEAVLRALTNRTATGVVLRSKLIRDEGPARVLNRGQEDPITVITSAPDDVSITIGVGSDQVSQVVTNGRGTVKSASGSRELTPDEVLNLEVRVGLRRELQILEQRASVSSLPPDQIDGRRMDVLQWTRSDGNRERLFFDAETALLRRRILFVPTPIGDDPQQVDFDDYRRIGGVFVPFAITVTVLDDNHYGSTIRFESVRHSGGDHE